MSVPPRPPSRETWWSGRSSLWTHNGLKEYRPRFTSVLIQQPFLLYSLDSNVALLKDKMDLAVQAVGCLWRLQKEPPGISLADQSPVSLMGVGQS